MLNSGRSALNGSLHPRYRSNPVTWATTESGTSRRLTATRFFAAHSQAPRAQRDWLSRIPPRFRQTLRHARPLAQQPGPATAHADAWTATSPTCASATTVHGRNTTVGKLNSRCGLSVASLPMWPTPTANRRTTSVRYSPALVALPRRSRRTHLTPAAAKADVRRNLSRMWLAHT